MLEAGGTAIDAAIAVQMVLTLVEPQSSGIGGGAFLLHWDGRELTALDGRETAPAAATDALFLRDGAPMPTAEAIVGGRSVGAPGVIRLLAHAHALHGTLPWARLFAPAIRLADEGFAISPRLARLLANEKALASDPDARAHFYTPDGLPKPVGTILRNPALAAVLRQVASDGGRRVLHRRHREGHRRQGARPSDQPGAAQRGRHRRLPAGGAHAALLRLSRCPDLRLPSARVRHDRAGADPRDARGPAHEGAGALAPRRAHTGRSRPRPSTCTPTLPASPLPIATPGSATPASWTCRWPALSIADTSGSARR